MAKKTKTARKGKPKGKDKPAEKNNFYVTTPIYYPNDIPHLGHAYTTIAADVLARWNKLLGKKVFFVTGTDEHGKKLERTAQKHNKTPKQFVDEIIPEFKKAWKELNIEYDRFIRTTDKDHEKIVSEIIKKCYDNGDIYKGEYSGLYCTDCEAYYTEKDAPEKKCPIHNRELELLNEETYFFKLSKYQKYLLDLYKQNPDFLSPKNKREEIINRVKEGLKDFSVSRTSFSWGIPLPFDKKHVIYVWFDALINYYSATQEKGKENFWPADVHIIGKDISWFHCVYWPAMLKSAGIEAPKKVFSHGWWTVHNEKMGKSAGNAIKISQLVNYAGVDSARYFLMREAPFGDDGDFSDKMLTERHNNELANKLGNLVLRISTLAEKYGLSEDESIDDGNLLSKVGEHMGKYEFDKALNEIFAFIDRLNEYVQYKKPWETHDVKVLWKVADGIKKTAILLYPFIPQTIEKIAETFNFKIGIEEFDNPLKITKIKKGEVLFRKIEVNGEKMTQTILKPNNEKSTPEGKISYDEFSKVQMKVGKIVDVKDHPNADKLYVLTVDLGEGSNRTIVAGLRKHYSKEQLIGKQAVFVANLAPVTLRGVESNGMILASVNGDESKVTFLTPEKENDVGSKVR